MTREEQWLLDEKYNGEKTQGFFADCARLKNNVPLAYIIGSIPFLNTTIYLDSQPLIPRTETEYWVSQILPLIVKKDNKETKILDLCAGSGCIGVSILANTKNLHVDFIEIDTKHHKTIKKNIEENNVSGRSNMYGGNLFEKSTGIYDVILTNPPYIDESLDRTSQSVIKNEPHRALFSKEAGLSHIREIIESSLPHLTKHGLLIIEHEPEQRDEIKKLADSHSFTVTAKRDQYDIYRYTILTRESD